MKGYSEQAAVEHVGQQVLAARDYSGVDRGALGTVIGCDLMDAHGAFDLVIRWHERGGLVDWFDRDEASVGLTFLPAADQDEPDPRVAQWRELRQFVGRQVVIPTDDPFCDDDTGTAERTTFARNLDQWCLVVDVGGYDRLVSWTALANGQARVV